MKTLLYDKETLLYDMETLLYDVYTSCGVQTLLYYV